MHIAMLVFRLFKLFIPSIIEKIAKPSGFMKCHSKLLPETFAKEMTLGLLDSKIITEEVVAEKCAAIQNGVSLSKQAIGARLHDGIPSLKELLKKAFSLIYSNALENHSSLLLKYFSDVKLLDATTISLPTKWLVTILEWVDVTLSHLLRFKHFIVPLIIPSPALILL